MTPAQARAARALLRLKMKDVAEGTRITPNTIQRLEAGGEKTSPGVVAALRAFYEASGVEFSGEDWVRLAEGANP